MNNRPTEKCPFCNSDRLVIKTDEKKYRVPTYQVLSSYYEARGFSIKNGTEFPST